MREYELISSVTSSWPQVDRYIGMPQSAQDMLYMTIQSQLRGALGDAIVRPDFSADAVPGLLATTLVRANEGERASTVDNALHIEKTCGLVPKMSVTGTSIVP